MTNQQKIDYLLGRCGRLLDELDVDDVDRIQHEQKLSTFTTVQRAEQIHDSIEMLMHHKGIEIDESLKMEEQLWDY